jgi:hypothetical protein
MLKLLQSSKYTNSIDKLIVPVLKCCLGLLPEHGNIHNTNTVGKKDTEIKLLVNWFVGFSLYRLIDDLKEKITV